jgi:hypothetical protein
MVKVKKEPWEMKRHECKMNFDLAKKDTIDN